MPKKESSFMQNSGYVITLGLCVVVVCAVLVVATKSIKETFLDNGHVTKANIKNASHTSTYKLVHDEENGYKTIFEERIPTFADHPCKPECCTHSKSMGLSCSKGCVCKT